MLEAIANVILLIAILVIAPIWIVSLVNYNPNEDPCRPEDCKTCPFPQCEGRGVMLQKQIKQKEVEDNDLY